MARQRISWFFWLACDFDYTKAEEIFKGVLADLKQHPKITDIYAKSVVDDGHIFHSLFGMDQTSSNGEHWRIALKNKNLLEYRIHSYKLKHTNLIEAILLILISVGSSQTLLLHILTNSQGKQ